MQVLDHEDTDAAPDVPAPRPHYPWWVALGVAFAVSRVLYARAGVRFDTKAIETSWQILPPDLLQHHLLQSLWNLHAQPPLLDVIAGIALKLPWNSDASLHVLFVVLGLALALAVFELAVELGAPLFMAFVATALLICSPSTALYESWFFGTYPTALFVVATVLFFARTIRTRSPVDAFGCTGAIALLVLTRPTYHALIAVALLAAIALIVKPREWSRRWRILVATPVLLVVALQVKNLVQFQQVTLSSWTGMNLAHMIFHNDADITQTDVAHGHLSHTALIPSFQPLDSYGVTPPKTGVPALDRAMKGTNPNFNNKRYIAISRQYLKDATKFVVRHPGAYAALVADSFRTAFTSPADYSWVSANRAKVSTWSGGESGILGQREDTYPVAELSPARFAPDARNIEWVVVVAYLGVGLLGIGALVQLVRRPSSRTAWRFALALAGLLVLYGVTASSLFELGENMRFRFETDPLVVAVATALLYRLGRPVAANFARRSTQAG